MPGCHACDCGAFSGGEGGDAAFRRRRSPAKRRPVITAAGIRRVSAIRADAWCGAAALAWGTRGAQALPRCGYSFDRERRPHALDGLGQPLGDKRCLQAQHAVAGALERAIPPRITRAGLRVVRAIHLHDQPRGWSQEVSNVAAEQRHLPAKGHALDLPPAQRGPEDALRPGRTGCACRRRVRRGATSERGKGTSDAW